MTSSSGAPPDTATTRVSQERGLVRATLRRSDAGNALRPEVLQELQEALETAEQDPACRALVIDADGDRFCTGLDLGYAQLPESWHDGGADALYWRLINRLRDSPVVTVALVDGPAIGGGAGLACACDLVVAGAAASFRLTEVFLGLLPAMIMPCLARRVGEQQVFRMALLAEEVGAAEAVRTGLADIAAVRAGEALPPILAGLRRTDRDTIGELKACRRMLFPTSHEYGLYASRLLGRRLDHPAVRDRIGRLRAAGMLP
jgi:polyketide biosynthesis enoyl-CoA hydratase PksH